MLYAIKADNEIVYIGQIQNPTEEKWRAEFEWHKSLIDAVDMNSLEDKEGFYFLLNYWKEAEGKRISMVPLDTGEFDDIDAWNLLSKVLDPIGNRGYVEKQL